MFGKKSGEPEERPPANPRARSSIYGLAALYLLYLFYKVAKPYLTGDPYAASTGIFLLAVVVLGGGAAALGYLSWRISRLPVPEAEPEEEPLPEGEDRTSLPEPEEENGEET